MAEAYSDGLSDRRDLAKGGTFELGSKLVGDAVAAGRVHTKTTESGRVSQAMEFECEGIKHEITIKQLAFVELYFYYSFNPLHGGSAAVDSVIEAGYDAYHKDKQGNSTGAINYNLARVICYENLAKPAIKAYFHGLTSTLKLSDETADGVLAYLLLQEQDKKVKLGAVRHYDQMNNRIKKDRAEQEVLKQNVEAINRLAEAMAQIIGKHAV